MADKQESAIESAFYNAIAKIYIKLRPALWRAQYRIIHRMQDKYDMSEIPAAWNILKLGMLADPYGKRLKRTARKIRDNMFDAIIANNDELLVWNFHMATMEQRMEFAKNTLMAMHTQISAKEPEVRPALKRVIKKDSPDKQQKKTVHATYSGHSGTIAMTEFGLSQGLCEVADTMAHEYTHALQIVLRSALPTAVLDFIRHHPRGYNWTPYSLRPKEAEAWAVGARVGKNFEDNFNKYYWENARD